METPSPAFTQGGDAGVPNGAGDDGPQRRASGNPDPDRASRPGAPSARCGEEEASDMFISEPLPRALGRYLLLRRIARGGMGEVFLASTTGLEGAERPVVVKLIRRDHAQDPSFIARFLDE